MSTNYYAVDPSTGCNYCGQNKKEKLHIGKISAGWAFLFRSHKDLGLTNYPKWVEYLIKMRIEDEYGDGISVISFLQDIADRKGLLCLEEYHKNNEEARQRENHLASLCGGYEYKDENGYRFSPLEIS